MTKPVVLSDLDDTLFQTRRKMTAEQARHTLLPGALDPALNPRSFMTQQQSMLVNWLLDHADLIPVTARGTEEFRRVTLAFTSWAVTTHGAVILTPAGQIEPAWQAHMLRQLAPYRERLLSMRHAATDMLAGCGIDAWVRLHCEYEETPVYLVLKHRDSTRLNELNALADRLDKLFLADGFYTHRNGNNVAWLPHPVDKGLAVSWLLEKLRAERGVFPVLGLGDSLSDHRFMRLCDWFGVPGKSQFADAISRQLFGGEEHA